MICTRWNLIKLRIRPIHIGIGIFHLNLTVTLELVTYTPFIGSEKIGNYSTVTLTYGKEQEVVKTQRTKLAFVLSGFRISGFIQFTSHYIISIR